MWRTILLGVVVACAGCGGARTTPAAAPPGPAAEAPPTAAAPVDAAEVPPTLAQAQTVAAGDELKRHAQAFRTFVDGFARAIDYTSSKAGIVAAGNAYLESAEAKLLVALGVELQATIAASTWTEDQKRDYWSRMQTASDDEDAILKRLYESYPDDPEIDALGVAFSTAAGNAFMP